MKRVCVHRVGSGHYTAYGSHEGRWYHFNDSTVTLTNEDTVKKAKAYILFYVERTGQVALDKIPSDSTSAIQPEVDTAATDCVSAEIVTQEDQAPADAEIVLMDGAAEQTDIPGDKEGGVASVNIASLNKTTMVSAEAAADEEISEQTVTEESMHTAAPEFTASD